MRFVGNLILALFCGLNWSSVVGLEGYDPLVKFQVRVSTVAHDGLTSLARSRDCFIIGATIEKSGVGVCIPMITSSLTPDLFTNGNGGFATVTERYASYFAVHATESSPKVYTSGMVNNNVGFVSSFPSFTQQPLRFEFPSSAGVTDVRPVAVRHGYIAITGTIAGSIRADGTSPSDAFISVISELGLVSVPSVDKIVTKLNLREGGVAFKVAIDDLANAWIIGTSSSQLFVTKYNIATSTVVFTNYYGEVMNTDRGADIVLNEYVSNGQTDVFATGYTDSDKLLVMRIDANDGKVAWQTTIDNAMGHTLQIVRDSVMVIGKKKVYLDNDAQRDWVLSVFHLDYATGKLFYQSCVESVEMLRESAITSVRIGEDIVVGHDIVEYEGHGHTDMLITVMSARGYADYCRDTPVSINSIPEKAKMAATQRALSIALPIVFGLLLIAAIVGAVKWNRYRKDKFRILEEIENVSGNKDSKTNESGKPKIELGDMTGYDDEEADEGTALSSRNATHVNNTV